MESPKASSFRSAFWFIVVGGCAALTHLGVYTVCINIFDFIKEAANACGFVVAFFVSFAGHRYLSFKDFKAPAKRSLWRFLCTALLGFFTNEALFTILWRVLGVNSWLALFIAIFCAAACTFVLSRVWAFQSKAELPLSNSLL
jgi:putative flippase GtrA